MFGRHILSRYVGHLSDGAGPQPNGLAEDAAWETAQIGDALGRSAKSLSSGKRQALSHQRDRALRCRCRDTVSGAQ